MSLDNNTALTKEHLKQFQKMNRPVSSLPSPRMLKTAKRIEAQFSGVSKIPTRFEIEEIYKRFIYALEKNDWGSLGQQDWRMAAYILWYKKDEKELIGSYSRFINRYHEWLQKNSLPSNWRKLIHVYLQDFQYRKDYPESFKKLSWAIRAAFKNPSLQQRLGIWEIRDQEFKLFSEYFEVRQVANAFVNKAGNDWNNFAEMTGLDGELGFGGYADAVGLELMNQLVASPSKVLIEAVIKFHFIDNRLRFNGRRVNVIESLLSPWTKNANFLGEDVRKMVQDLLLAQFNDPRLPHHKANGWRSVGETYLQVFFRWLIGESLEQFFEVIDQIALEHQWKYRKAFWKAYHKRGLLDGAWVALGADAKSYAQTAFGKTLSAADLEGGSKSDHSVLIIRIKDLILAEWSDNGKCRAWRVDQESCPLIYETKYHGSQLKTPSMKIVPSYKTDGITHSSSETYSWQRKLSEFIYDETGIRIQHNDFKI